MATIDTLTILDGYVQGRSFILQKLAGYAVEGKYSAEGLALFARLIDSKGEVLVVKIDNERQVRLIVEQSIQLRKELLELAGELEA
ncbi:hypothetical protein [Bacillus alkalicellulosilyticus]|uniref:hypothetical protein n=1 Tax=Alkalihalobacterium alkalicellulosilyticum TaxID=1912214 RepID=UPI0009986FDB|nr:hypothetical protein [Bacillus alkalicellulosilyticus]